MSERKLSEAEALEAAEELLKMYAQIDREIFEREQDKIETFEIKF